MLSQGEQGLLKQLAAFPAAFDLESAEEIFGPATAGELAGLMDRCLVVTEGGPGTYRLLETVKLFARRQWPDGPDPDVYLDRHADALLAHIGRWSDDEIYSLNSVMGWHARRLHDLAAADDHLHNRGDPIAACRLWSGGAILWHLGQSASSARAIERLDRCLAARRRPAKPSGRTAFIPPRRRRLSVDSVSAAMGGQGTTPLRRNLAEV
jgi:hypothetical protein